MPSDATHQKGAIDRCSLCGATMDGRYCQRAALGIPAPEPSVDFSRYSRPTLAVECPDCGASAGLECKGTYGGAHAGRRRACDLAWQAQGCTSGKRLVLIKDQTTTPAGLTFAELGDLARRLANGFPTSIPALSEIEAAGLVGALRALWQKEASRGQ